ncbi:hypothetical protein CAPTEDRAFT_187522 [Capitella teleta]|uniref:Uncharacterized protein n=1 Tax=Capitella teleta TaxID=283909 RepID=R7TMU2_CAPTE|nr:hypothetical protein CAPTEDRAFT_187522 [Capitella teleta]|eukprot:ELT95193.1 hypothetical protein CAPTEDRAFT_187522 [Capitella teleta]
MLTLAREWKQGIPKILHRRDSPTKASLKNNNAVSMEPGTSIFAPCLSRSSRSNCTVPSMKGLEDFLVFLAGKNLWCCSPESDRHAEKLIDAYQRKAESFPQQALLVKNNQMLLKESDFLYGFEKNNSPHSCSRRENKKRKNSDEVSDDDVSSDDESLYMNFIKTLLQGNTAQMDFD